MKFEVKTTHSCLRFLLIFAQCFGMLPVTGITKQSTELKFKWVSKRMLYSFLFAAAAIANTVLWGMKMVRENNQKFGDWGIKYVTLAFYLVTAVTVLMFIDVAKKWPSLLKRWTETEMEMSSYGFPHGLHKRLKLISAVIFGAAVVEHSLFLMVNLKASGIKSDFMETIDLFFMFRFDYVFAVIGYHVTLGIFLQVLNIFSTVSWNFMDLFIIVVSLCLSERFKQVSKTVSFLASKHVTYKNLWKKVREDYTRLTVLCEHLDCVMSTVVLVSFGNNMFVILVQLFNTLASPPLDDVLNKIYYVYSFAFLLIRITAVALYASTVYTESKKPSYYLNTSSYSVYNVEIERLLHQAKYNTSVLTGHKLFRVTKTLILRITIAIVAYELVLVQFLNVKVN